jgi:hypothetical protein
MDARRLSNHMTDAVKLEPASNQDVAIAIALGLKSSPNYARARQVEATADVMRSTSLRRPHPRAS